NALKHRIIHAHVVRFRAYSLLLLGIENDNVGVRADRDSSFAGIQTEKFRWSCRNDFDEAVRRETFAVHAAGEDKAKAVLESRPPIRNLGEIVLAQFLLFLETKWAVIGGDNLQGVLDKALPQFFLVPFFPERRRENVLCSLESRRVHIFQRKIQILRAGFRISGQAAVARFANL